MKRFYLGCAHPNWLADPRRAKVRLFVSRHSLYRRKALPRAVAPWGQDSSGFTVLSREGCWPFTGKQYAAETRRFHDEIGKLEHVAIMDWMCEPAMRAKTGLSVREHQRRTVDSYQELTALDGKLPWMPVLQGYAFEEYLEHAELYARRGIDLTKVSLVGVGSICRRQATDEAARIIGALAALGLKLHGFGLKVDGLVKVHREVESADSMAWSKAGWKRPNVDHEHMKRASHKKRGCAKNCANCIDYAFEWHKSMMMRIAAEGRRRAA